jgi:CubicO group peptidase (beta-lactamase class C family)
MEKPALQGIADPTFKTFCGEILESMEPLHVPGAAVGILHEGKEFVAGFGVTNLEHPLDVTADTLFQIGSITKTFIGTAVMRLVETGKLDLDLPVRTYLPDLRLADEEVAAKVTMRHLLTHTGGWFGDYFDDLGPGDDALAKMVRELAGLPQQTPLGEVWAYNNAGFYIAGRVIEVVTGKPFEAAAKKLVLEPLGMERAYFFPADVITHRFAVGHEVQDDEVEVARPWAIGRAVAPAGGIVTTVRELLRYARFHMGDGTAADGTRLLAPESLQAMRDPQVEAGGSIDAMGLTWALRRIDDLWVARHGGGTNGQVSTLETVPERNFALAILTNSSRGGLLINDLTRSAFNLYLGIDDPEPEAMSISEEALRPYVGDYQNPMVDIELRLAEGELIISLSYKGGFPTKDTPPSPSPPPAPLAFYATDRVLVTEGPMKGGRGEFLRSPDGSIAWLRASGRLHARQEEA